MDEARTGQRPRRLPDVRANGRYSTSPNAGSFALAGHAIDLAGRSGRPFFTRLASRKADSSEPRDKSGLRAIGDRGQSGVSPSKHSVFVHFVKRGNFADATVSIPLREARIGRALAHTGTLRLSLRSSSGALRSALAPKRPSQPAHTVRASIPRRADPPTNRRKAASRSRIASRRLRN